MLSILLFSHKEDIRKKKTEYYKAGKLYKLEKEITEVFNSSPEFEATMRIWETAQKQNKNIKRPMDYGSNDLYLFVYSRIYEAILSMSCNIGKHKYYIITKSWGIVLFWVKSRL